jgi:hypothetical protein
MRYRKENFGNCVSQLWYDTALCDTNCQLFATGQCFSPGTPVSSTNKTDPHDIKEILVYLIGKYIMHKLTHFVIYFKCSTVPQTAISEIATIVNS